ncbi:MAG: hypothetical protein V3S39_05290 [Thermodesulfobacteriota bacterium]
MAKIRDLLEAWFQRFPEAGKPDLSSRFRDRTNSQHQAAFFELYMHELLRSMGFKVRVHPDLPGTTDAHPDFLVIKDGLWCFYLEATLVSPSEDEAAEEARTNVIYDTLNKMNSPNFFLHIRCAAAGKKSPPGARLRQELERWLIGLDPDKCRERLESKYDNMHSFRWRHDGWDIHFRAVPRSPSHRGQPGVRPIGSIMQAIWRFESHKIIRAVIEKKATKYRELNLPYIVAVNVIDDSVDDIDDIMDGLFGQLNITTTLRPNGSIKERERRDPNGAWLGPRGPQNTRVSAALITLQLSPWKVATQTPKMFHNPWATRPLPIDLWPLPHWIINLNKICPQYLTGKSTAEVLGLPALWPFADEDVV